MSIRAVIVIILQLEGAKEWANGSTGLILGRVSGTAAAGLRCHTQKSN